MSEINALFAIEPLMYFGIGFLAATLIAIAIFPLALNRAVRLTTRRVMSTMPHSLTEASAEKDTMRAMSRSGNWRPGRKNWSSGLQRKRRNSDATTP
jgi:hypothetical protein